MTYLITPPQTWQDHEIVLPASKSISNRALLIRALAHSDAPLHNVSDCNDTKAMLAALKDNPEVVDIGAAGTAMRFLTAYYAMQEGEVHVLTGSQRMQERPIAPLVDALRKMGADITYLSKKGFPPLRIAGKKLTGGFLEIPGNISSQFISAILMVAPYMAKCLNLSLTGNISSIPYINMTVTLMSKFGANVKWSGRNMLTCDTIPYKPEEYTIEPDWSAASYWFEIAGLASSFSSELFSFVFPNLPFEESLQGDREIRSLFEKALHLVYYAENTRAVCPSMKAPTTSLLRCDFTHIPDLAQTAVVFCCMMDIPFLFYGLESLYIKETNRIEALKNELYKLGYELRDDGVGTLTWQRGTHCYTPKPVIETYSDHRMAMAFAPCCMKYGEIRIAHPEVVSKSYPNFWEDLRSVGFGIQEIAD